jgi:hypothetical protein
MPYPVQNLIEGRGEPVSVYPYDSLGRAWSLMTEREFSQLPVIDEAKRPIGLVTHASILSAMVNFGVHIEDLKVTDATVRMGKSQLFSPDDDLSELLDTLRDANAVLIVDGEGKLTGIVTSYDSNEYFRRRAEDIILVQDIETTVRELALAPFVGSTGAADQQKLEQALKEISATRREVLGRYGKALRRYLDQLPGKPSVDQKLLQESFTHLDKGEAPKSLEDLTLWEYTELLLDKSRWEYYRSAFAPLKQEALRKMLSGIRDIRNVLAHFKREITSAERQQLEFCSQWLSAHPIQFAPAWPMPQPSVTRPDGRVHDLQEAKAEYSVWRPEEHPVEPQAEVVSPQDTRYAPLAIWMQGQSLELGTVILSFSEIEGILGINLPSSARQHRSWWANDSVGHVQSQQWLDSGWRVSYLNLTEQRVTFARIQERQKAYIEFFSALDKSLAQIVDYPLKGASPDGQSWHTLATLPRGGPQLLYFVAAFVRGKRFRMELYIDVYDEIKNKAIFDELFVRAQMIERALEAELSWERLPERRASRIAWYRRGAITDGDKALSEVRIWAVDAAVRFYSALAEPAEQALAAIQAAG